MSNNSLANKVCMITGAASGIGEAAAVLFAENGARVLVADIQEEKGRAVAEAIGARGGQADFLHLDVIVEGGWTQAMSYIQERYGRLDVLVNNAGIGYMKPILEMSLDQWRRVMSINLESVFMGIKHGAAVMAKNSPTGGVIINISSNLIFKSPPDNAAYCVSKSGVHMLTQVAAVELAPKKIRVNTVFPGATLTSIWAPMLEEMKISAEALERVGAKMTLLERMPRARDVAGAIYYFASDTAAAVTGAHLIVDSGEILRREQKIFEALKEAAQVVFKDPDAPVSGA